jgi:hypothetical protein
MGTRVPLGSRLVGLRWEQLSSSTPSAASTRCDLITSARLPSRHETLEKRLPELSQQEHVSERAVRRVLKK